MKKSKRIITFLTALVLILTLAVLSGAVRAEVTDQAYGFDSYKPILGDADLLYRPAFVPDPTAVMQTTLQPTGDEAFDTMYQTWFASNTKWSYVDNQIPWTRPGYTYDWADNGTEYGLSAFIVIKGASPKVAYTYSIDDFIAFVK